MQALAKCNASDPDGAGTAAQLPTAPPLPGHTSSPRPRRTWVMEGHQSVVADGLRAPAERPLQDARGPVHHLHQVVVHGAGDIEDKGKSGPPWGALGQTGGQQHPETHKHPPVGWHRGGDARVPGTPLVSLSWPFPRAPSPHQGRTRCASGHTRRGRRRDPGQGTPSPPQLRTCSSSVQLLGGRRQGGRKNRTFGASDAAGMWVGVGGNRNGDTGIGKQILQPTGLSEALPRPPPQRRPSGSERPCSAGGSRGLGEDTGVTAEHL